MERLKVSEQIDQFIAENGGNERDALNVALDKLEQATRLLESGFIFPSFDDWDMFAEELRDELGESIIEEGHGEGDPYNWWLRDVTVSDIVDFVKSYQ